TPWILCREPIQTPATHYNNPTVTRKDPPAIRSTTMPRPPTGTPLGVDIEFPTFDRKTGVKQSDAFITISFNDADHADRYYDYLTETRQSFHNKYNLRAVRRGRRAIKMRLPSFFGSVSASAQCSGFRFSIDKGDREYVDEWVSVLKLWVFLPGSRTETFVTRDWYNYPDLVDILLPSAPRNRTAKAKREDRFEDIDKVQHGYTTD
ncbi:hypothetical protein QBC47DRAFT_80873, partial [Echria macrotheca]